MKSVEPKVFLIGETKVLDEGLHEYLAEIGVPDWDTDAPSDSEKLVEVMSRGCYMSYASEETSLKDLNPNLTRTRAGNKAYLDHITKVGHGSVVEHPALSFMFVNVSRVFTHELVRHRVGVAISQQSLRFVRLTDLGFWLPPAIEEKYPEAAREMRDAVRYLENVQATLADLFDVDNLSFAEKKKVTSAMRRVAPIGLATQIGWSANHRTMRHVIEMRTHPSAEDEIRFVYAKVAAICQDRYPNMYGDYVIEVVDGIPWYHTERSKV